MPMKPPRICSPCGLRVAAGERCPCERRRAAAGRARHDATRPSARQRGYDADWERVRADFLARPENRYCVCGCGRRADVVDHIKPHKGDRTLFWDRANWQPMAFGCNSRKAARQEGGFGHPQRKPGAFR